jgi:hypothetical protein
MNGYGKLRRCTERNPKRVDFYLYLAAALVTIRQLIQRARSRYRWDTRPTTKRLKLRLLPGALTVSTALVGSARPRCRKGRVPAVGAEHRAAAAVDDADLVDEGLEEGLTCRSIQRQVDLKRWPERQRSKIETY